MNIISDIHSSGKEEVNCTVTTGFCWVQDIIIFMRQEKTLADLNDLVRHCFNSIRYKEKKIRLRIPSALHESKCGNIYATPESLVTELIKSQMLFLLGFVRIKTWTTIDQRHKRSIIQEVKLIPCAQLSIKKSGQLGRYLHQPILQWNGQGCLRMRAKCGPWETLCQITDFLLPY